MLLSYVNKLFSICLYLKNKWHFNHLDKWDDLEEEYVVDMARVHHGWGEPSSEV